ncbi:aminotransferase class IV [Salinimicrobium sp. MT39]|uniref:branched-chain-amino-acid transaminase n=1 Tax=Salinimicrobium profundisediminis TaxID=2994553 RepID=A0A9X3CX44_9FLAO|nr:aminotransferase class IV [Salinimicrobium profundisediminis]MCX2838315.1 aminotransferase class IV [Salinimicrobium profundisediminis]
MVNINGQLFEEKEASLSIANRGFAYGDAVFETIRVINGRIIFWEDHYFRLMASMRIMRMDIPATFSPEFLEAEILQIVRENDLFDTQARVKLNVSRQAGGFYTPQTNEIDYLITAEALPDAFYLLNEDFYEVELFKDHYVAKGLLSTLKTNNRAVNVLAGIYAIENDYHNCLLLNEQKNVVEALNGNIFLVVGNVIKTPPITDGCLKGITRGKILEIIKKLPDYTFEEASISPFELQKADEMFISNVVMGIQPVKKYRKKEYSSEVAKVLLGRLNTLARLS